MKKILSMVVVTLMIAGSAAFADNCSAEKKAGCSAEKKAECSAAKTAECTKEK